MAVRRSIPDSIADTLPEPIINDSTFGSSIFYSPFLYANYSNTVRYSWYNLKDGINRTGTEWRGRFFSSQSNINFPFTFFPPSLKRFKIRWQSPIVNLDSILVKIRSESCRSKNKIWRENLEKQVGRRHKRREIEGISTRVDPAWCTFPRLSSRSAHSTIYVARMNHLQCRILQINQCQLLRIRLNEKR